MDDRKFCCVGDFSVLVPYRDLEKLLEVANNMERYERTLDQTHTQLAALRNQYTELLAKIGEMSKLI